MYLDDYKPYMERALYLHGDEAMFGRPLKHRYYTFEYVLDHLVRRSSKPVSIVELGTSRSFVTGGMDGCMVPDPMYWYPNRPEAWDHGAGIFTYLIPKALQDANVPFEFDTVDICEKAMSICRVMTHDMQDVVRYHTMGSTEFLENMDHPVDLIYMDQAETEELGARLHLEDAKIIVERNLVKIGGLILIDDVHWPAFIHMAGKDWVHGKGRYSIPYFLQNGFTMVMDEYQVILKRQW